MKKLATLLAAMAASSTAAVAGGLDRSGQNISIAFEAGDYVQLSYGSVNPMVSGTYASGSMASGDIAPHYSQSALGYRNQLTENLAIAIIYDQPWGAHSSYPTSGTFGALTGTRAEMTSRALTMMGMYRADESFTFYGGLKSTTIELTAAVPGGGVLSYTATGSSSQALGYLVGAAYEIPEIALRASLTYHSSSTFDVPTSETSFLTGGATVSSTTRIVMPEAINLDFQTGVAADTLLMAGVRWANWTQTSIAPNHYSVTLGRGPLQSYSEDAYTWTLGVGRRFNENLSGSLMLGHEKAQGGTSGDLAPTDGYNSISAGLSYQVSNVELAGGIRYVQLGDATSTGAGVANGTFRDNSAVGVGVSIGFAF